MATGADRLVRSLEAEGGRHGFCIPGAKIDKVIDRLVDSPIRLVVCRHEQNAALIAQGIGRMTGKAGVCLVTSGPGCTNLATADDEGDQVVALGGAVPLSDRLNPAHQALDGVGLFRPITRFAAEVTAAHAIPEVVGSAYRAAERGRAGAAFVVLPNDVMEGSAPGDHPGPSPRPRTGPPDPGAVAEAAGRIDACLARPGRQVLSMSGDGGFLFSAQELETAVRLRCDFVHLVWTDGSYDMVKIQQDAKCGRHAAVELGPLDVVKYAEAFGATGMRVRTAADVAPSLRAAFRTPGPVLVDVPIDYRDNPGLLAAVHPEEVH